jgi:hypothetical protein
MSEQTDGFWAEAADPSQEHQRRREALLGTAAQARANDFTEMLSGGSARAEFEATHAHLTRSKQGILGAMTGEQAAQNVSDRPMTTGSEWGEERVVQRHDSPFAMTQHLYGPGARFTGGTRTGQPEGADRVSPLMRYLQGRQ